MRLPPSSAVLDHTSAFPLTSPPLSQTPREAGRTSHLVSRPKPPSQRPHCCLSQSEYVTGLGTLSPEAGLGKTQLPGPLGTTAGPRPSPGLPARAVGRACDRVLPAPCLGSWRGLVMPLRVSSHFGRISLDPLGPPRFLQQWAGRMAVLWWRLGSVGHGGFRSRPGMVASGDAQ